MKRYIGLAALTAAVLAVPIATPARAATVPEVAAFTVSITGKVVPGHTVRAVHSRISPSNVTIKYQWAMNGVKLRGSTSASHSFAARSDVGKELEVFVSASKKGFRARTVEGKHRIYAGVVKSAIPKISGSREVGKTLTAVPGTWAKDASFSYQWYSGGRAIRGATGKTHRLSSAAAGHSYAVKVTGRVRNYYSASKTSAPTMKVTRPATVSQRSAIADAKDYLSMEGGFSRRGLIEQLEFDRFSASDAAYGVDHSGANWNAQAVLDAKSYQELEGGFSHDGLVEQLEFDGFTPSQAEHGVRAVGL